MQIVQSTHIQVSSLMIYDSLISIFPLTENFLFFARFLQFNANILHSYILTNCGIRQIAHIFNTVNISLLLVSQFLNSSFCHNDSNRFCAPSQCAYLCLSLLCPHSHSFIDVANATSISVNLQNENKNVTFAHQLTSSCVPFLLFHLP